MFNNLLESKPKKEKPSDYFRLRRFEIHDGQIVFEDRRQRSNRPPLTWKNLTVALDTEPASGSLYSYELSANNAGMATASMAMEEPSIVSASMRTEFKRRWVRINPKARCAAARGKAAWHAGGRAIREGDWPWRCRP